MVDGAAVVSPLGVDNVLWQNTIVACDTVFGLVVTESARAHSYILSTQVQKIR